MSELTSKKPTANGVALVAVLLVSLILCVATWFAADLSTNMDQENTWGLLIAVFFALEALCAGSLFIAAVDKESDRCTLSFVSVVCGLGAAVAIIADLGSPLVMWRLFLTPNVLSPILLDVVFLSLCLILGIVMFFMSSKKTEGGAMKAVSVLSAVFAVCLPIGTSWLCTTLTGRVGWSHSLEVAIFVLQALIAGLLLEVLLCGSSRKRALGALLFVNAGGTICELGLAVYTNGNDMISTVELATGAYAPVFWVQLVLGVIVPAAMLVADKYVKAACGIAVAGLFLGKFLYLVKGNLFTRATIEDYTLSTFYVPALGEWIAAILIVVFVAAAISMVAAPAKRCPA